MQFTDTLGNIITFDFNNTGGLIKTTDAFGKTEKKAYDLAGNVISQPDGNNNVTAFTYTKENLLASVTTPLWETSYIPQSGHVSIIIGVNAFLLFGVPDKLQRVRDDQLRVWPLR